MLKDKTHATSEEWAYCFEHIEEFISKEDVIKAYNSTLDFIRQTIKGHNVAFGWSGGKESIVLADLMRDTSVHRSVLALNSCLCYSSFTKWCLEHKPKDCEVFDSYQTLNFRVMRQLGIEAFSDDLKQYHKFTEMTDHKAYPYFCKKNGITMFILGRRKRDNNICGKAPHYITTNKLRDYCCFSPMAEWTTEEVLGYIRYFKGGYEALPPQYRYVNGWQQGSDAPIYLHLEGKTRNEMWQLVYDNDKELVERASSYLKSAQIFLKTTK